MTEEPARIRLAWDTVAQHSSWEGGPDGWHGTEGREQPPARQTGTGQQMEQALSAVHAPMREPGGAQARGQILGYP